MADADYFEKFWEKYPKRSKMAQTRVFGLLNKISELVLSENGQDESTCELLRFG